MKILIPLAGRGSRFIEEGYKELKPLIPIIKRPMIIWATANLKAEPQDLIFLILQKHIDEAQFDKRLQELFGNEITIVPVAKITDGAPITLMLAKDIINTDEEIIIWNGDQYFDSDVLSLVKNLDKDVKGAIPVFSSNLPRFSYVKVDDKMTVLETAEKVPISSLATVGIYYFRHGKDFVWAVEQMIEKDVRRGNEFFVCPAYNELIERGDRILAIKVDNVWPLGTPEDMQHFERYYKGPLL